MANITLNNIFQPGNIYAEDEDKVIYLTPQIPLVFDANKWVYKQMPSIKQWKAYLATQTHMHKQQSSNHLTFTFPENIELDQQWIALINQEQFELGLMELYAIEPQNFEKYVDSEIEVKVVDENTIDDYISVHSQFAAPYGEEYVRESSNMIKNQYINDAKTRLIAYKQGVPAGILDLIIDETTVEIDGFGVLACHQRQGVGSVMQSFAAALAMQKPLILIADGEDSAKDMYVKQGYVFISFCYHIVKEDI